MIIGESEKKKFWVILWVFVCLFVLGGCVLDFYTVVLYLGFLNLSLFHLMVIWRHHLLLLGKRCV